MSVLLTGGAGYIGLHTAVALIDAGYEVVIADNFSNSKPEAVKNAEKITGRKIPVYNIDVESHEAMRKVFSENKIDAAVHFAGLKAVGESVAKPLKYYRNNLDTAITLLEVMAEFGVKKIVFSSSATVYSASNPIPYVEGMPRGSTNPYGWTKLMIEQIIEDAAAADSEISAVLLRYFNPIGAHESGLIGEDPQGIPNNLMPYITQVAVGKLPELRVFGDDYPTRDGTGVRDYIHVMDLARGHVAALEYADKNTGAEVFNLGTGVGYSVFEIIKAFEQANDIKIPNRVTPRRPGDLAEYFADPTKANTILGWKAEKTLEDMCRDSWRFQKNNI